ncbi:MAG: type IV toxin-antitoxin system AbiEi family antitoxin domain-containing protein [Longimicrobiales bacterium]
MTETERLLKFLADHGQMRWKDVAGAGFNANLLYHLLKRGEIERVGHGLYRVPGSVTSEHEALTEVAHLVPDGVICLLSALAFHGIGTQMPRAVWVALNHREHRTRPDVRNVPTEFVWFSGLAFTEGQEVHELDGIAVRVYSPAKTTADLFKYRFKLGLDVALEALREGLAEGRFTPAEAGHFARICRVEAVMKPYIQGMTK